MLTPEFWTLARVTFFLIRTSGGKVLALLTRIVWLLSEQGPIAWPRRQSSGISLCMPWRPFHHGQDRRSWIAFFFVLMSPFWLIQPGSWDGRRREHSLLCESLVVQPLFRGKIQLHCYLLRDIQSYSWNGKLYIVENLLAWLDTVGLKKLDRYE